MWLVVLSLALGGVLKGATGAGAPIVAVPIMAMAYDVRFAVTVMIMPNLLSNLWQAWLYRAALQDRGFVANLAVAGAIGAGLGTWMLAALPSEWLTAVVAVVTLAYVGFRVAKPSWRLAEAVGRRIAFPVGLLGGTLQGASGVSAPVSITFLNALQLERPRFIATISIFFFMMSAVQLPFLVMFGLMNWHRFWLGLVALAVIFAFMPVGGWAAQRISKRAFDRLILGLLTLLALRLLGEAFI